VDSFTDALQGFTGHKVNVGYDGRTDQLIGYRREYNRTSRGAEYSGTYTTGRTKRRFVLLAKVHARLAVGQHSYFITHGMDHTHSEKERRERFRQLLDRLRKLPGYRGHLWVTERHTGDGPCRGMIHHHIILRMAVRWDYTKHVTAWSWKYCDSINGLDIDPVKSANVGGYCAKALGYMCKDTGTADTLPFRWWGTSKIQRTVEALQDDVPLYRESCDKVRGTYNEGFVVSKRHPYCSVFYATTCIGIARSLISAATAQYEKHRALVNHHRRMQKRALSRPCKSSIPCSKD